MNTELQLGVRKKLWRWMVVTLPNSGNVANATELHT